MRSSAFAAVLAAAALVAAAAEAADPIAAGKERAEPCAACHGQKGISEMENMPSLAGQPDNFIQWQLVYFQLGRRKHEIMEPLAKELSNEEIRNLAAYYASLAPPPPAEADDDPALSEQGAAIAAQHHCGNCHKEDYSGQQATPRLAGQREDVLLKSLRDYKSGERSGGGVAAMPKAVAPLSDDDLVALAHFLAHLK